jgi:endo-1,4-beta-xylanase
MIARKVPIDGIGSQTHLQMNKFGDFEQNMLKLVNETGLDLAITELDIRIKPVNATTLLIQKQNYQRVMNFCLQMEKCVGLSIWGISDKDSWITQDFDKGFWKPLLWDDDLKKKPAFYGVLDALSGSPF